YKMLSQQFQWEEITKKFSEILYPLGFDLVKAFPAQRYNSNISPASSLAPLPTYFRTSTLSIIVGNTKLFWPNFLKFYTKFSNTAIKPTRSKSRSNYSINSSSYDHDDDLERFKQSNPLDWYTIQSITSAVKQLISINISTRHSDIKYDIRYTFDSDEKKFVAFQRLAQDAGLAYYNRSCFLCVHKEFGPWFALRAVVTLDIEGPTDDSYLFPPLKNPYPEGDALLKLKMAKILGTENHNYHQSASLSHSVKYEPAETKTSLDNNIIQKNFMNSRDNTEWYEWVELRDIASGFMTKCNLEKYRYSEEQIEYHYTHNLKLLQDLCKKIS
ncbi:33931_t:CDS:2, partial [Racocetra persica]